ncbi:MAG: zinc-binding dehydrogenase [Actinomycetota bacterium]
MIDYTQDDFTKGETRYDVILDTGGFRSLSELRGVLAPKGTLVLVGAEVHGRVLGGFDRQIRASLLSPFVSQRLRALASKDSGSDLLALKELIEAGKLAPVIDRTFPLSDAAEAIRYMREGKPRGKVVVTV